MKGGSSLRGDLKLGVRNFLLCTLSLVSDWSLTGRQTIRTICLSVCSRFVVSLFCIDKNGFSSFGVSFSLLSGGQAAIVRPRPTKVLGWPCICYWDVFMGDVGDDIWWPRE